jgi:excinuclease UvrABC ATPase subunit
MVLITSEICYKSYSRFAHFNTLIEDNLDLIANADYVIDIEPGSGEVLFEGSQSKTAPFLKEALKSNKKAP